MQTKASCHPTNTKYSGHSFPDNSKVSLPLVDCQTPSGTTSDVFSATHKEFEDGREESYPDQQHYLGLPQSL